MKLGTWEICWSLSIRCSSG